MVNSTFQLLFLVFLSPSRYWFKGWTYLRIQMYRDRCLRNGEGTGTPLQYSCLENSMEEPGRLQSMGSLRVGHDWVTSLSLFTFLHWRRIWQPTPVFLPGESQGRGSWWAALYGVAQSRTRLKWLSSSSSSSSNLLCPKHCRMLWKC